MIQDTTALPKDLASARQQIRRLRSQIADYREQAAAAEHEIQCFRELAEHVHVVFWITNPPGDELVYISPAYEHIWGQTCASLHADPGQRLAWVHDDDRERVLKAFKRDAAQGDYNEIFRITRPDGEIRWVCEYAVPIYNAQNEVYRLAGIAINLTDAMTTHDRMAALQSLIATRERISVFASLSAALTHDLGQPLTSARNFIRRAHMLADNSDSETPDLLLRTDREIERAVSIVRHVRDFAREGRPTLCQQPLYPVLSEVRDLFEPTLRAERVTYTGPDAPSLDGLELPIDRVLIQQVLWNLLGNAVAALSASSRPPHQPHITLTVDAAPDDYVDIYVSDNGDGIDDGVDLFAPFATTKLDGLGLGLKVSRSLARRHGGDLSLNSRGSDDDRTCFKLRLPRCADRA